MVLKELFIFGSNSMVMVLQYVAISFETLADFKRVIILDDFFNPVFREWV